MKTFIIALSLLLIMTIGVIINMVYIENVTDELREYVYRLPEDNISTEGKIKEIKLYWQEHLCYINLTVRMEYTDAITSELLKLESSIKSDSYENYIEALLQLKNALDQLEKVEKASVNNILSISNIIAKNLRLIPC